MTLQTIQATTLITSKKRVTTNLQRGIIEGYRSGLEEKTANDLTSKGVGYTYEEFVIEYKEPEKNRKYTPDFQLDNGIIIETKGRFISDDRAKHKLVKEQHPHLDIRFVFSNSKAKISKTSKTTYAAWCEKYGFKYADKVIPDSWLKEPKSA
jgi:hypothetical protein